MQQIHSDRPPGSGHDRNRIRGDDNRDGSAGSGTNLARACATGPAKAQDAMGEVQDPSLPRTKLTIPPLLRACSGGRTVSKDRDNRFSEDFVRDAHAAPVGLQCAVDPVGPELILKIESTYIEFAV